MNICIIGAGYGGISAAKVAKENGLTPVILNRDPVFGGLWNALPNQIGAWNNIKAHTSKHCFTFSDFNWDIEGPDPPTREMVLEYLRRYVRKHDLEKYIHYNSVCVEVSRIDGRYLVKWVENGEKKEDIFQYVIVAVGHFSKEYFPFRNAEVFEGKIILSGYYREAAEVANKKVVVIGNGPSGIEISANIINEASKVTQILKNDRFFINAKIFGIPFDLVTFSLQSIASRENPLLLTEDYITPANEKTMGIVKIYSKNKLNKNFNPTPNSLYRMTAATDEYLNALEQNKIEVVYGKVSEFYPKGIILEDGTQIEADVVISCVGYSTDYSFLSEEIKTIIRYNPQFLSQPLIMYRGLIHPELPGLGFLGSIIPTLIGKFELPAEIIIRNFLGNLDVSEEELWEGVRQEERLRASKDKFHSPYQMVSLFAEWLRILKIEINIEFFANELDYPKGPYLPQFLFLDRPGQIDLAKEAIKKLKEDYSLI